jgi:hypothetical protein
MKQLITYIQILLLTAIASYSVSCKKNPGPGGQATVMGKVYAYDFDNTYTYMLSKGYREGEKVYIVYGENQSVGNNMVTSIGGTFEFKYLNKGHYKVFANSVDTSFKFKGNNAENPVIKEFDIKDFKQKIVLDDIIINK